ncbi:MFS transporter [Aromatoleum evansii]|uniref:MFS transporter n=1 Tax=Aromatoleum evansii TaxID=59406 RepID=A0ABZ1AU27_AROEV|nr:MFS transporter [Aromatoleum evansii]NMG29488.1 MFS transporter [Aromatoleum evansii]WRL48486.1 MFS transporter [Aromatoleum evansii]
MLAHTLPIATLMSGVALLLIGNGLLGTLVAVRGNDAGFTDAFLGLLGSGYFAGYLVGSLLARPFIQRVGHIRAFAFFAVGIAGVALLHGLFVSPIVWVALRVLAGAAIVALYMLIESWLNDQTPQALRGRIFAIYMVVNQLSLAAAQQLLRFDSADGLALFMASALFVCLAVMPVTSTRLTQPTPHRAASYPLLRIVREIPVAAAGAFFTGTALGAFWSMGPVYAARAGAGEQWVPLFMSAGILGGALLQWPLGVLSDRIDRRKALAIAAALATVSALPLLVPGLGQGVAVAAIALFGGFGFAIYPMAVAHLVDHLPADNIVAGSSAVLLLHGIGAAIGPMAVGLAMGWIGSSALPLYLIVVHALLALVAWTAARRQPDEILEHAHFVPMMRTSATVLEIMPTPEHPAKPGTQDSAAPTPRPGET